MKRALIVLGIGIALAVFALVGGTREDLPDGGPRPHAGRPAPTAPSEAHTPSRPSEPAAALAIPRLRMRAVPDRIDPSTLKRLEREDGAVGVVLPNGSIWYGMEETTPGPYKPGVLPAIDLLNRYPNLANRFQQSLKSEALHDCGTARTTRQGVVEAEIDWTMTVRASVRDGKFKVDDVSSDTWPDAFDREYFECLSDVLAAAEWESSDGLSDIAFEYPFRQTAPPDDVEEDDEG